MLVVLVIGSAASLVMMALPNTSQENAQRQLARFQAQFEVALDASRQRGAVLGVRVRPDAWQFYQLLQQQPTAAATRQANDRWQGYIWQIWHPRRTALSANMPENIRLDLHLEDPQAWPPAADAAPMPDILILPGGEITPFTLTFRAENAALAIWLRIDEHGTMTTSLGSGATP